MILDDVPKSHRDLLQARLVVAFTTIDRRGRPQSTAVWYLLDEDGQLKCSITSDRQKYKNLRANDSCDLFIIDPANSYRTLEVRAEAELRPDPEKEMVRKLAAAYSADEAMLLAAGDDRYTVTLQPRRIRAQPATQQ